MNSLKIYSSKEWLQEGTKIILMLAPYWGFTEVSADDPDHGRFDEYLKEGKEIFEFVQTLEQSDIAVYPHECPKTAEGLLHLQTISSLAKSNGKRLLVFFNSDDDGEIKVENCLLFRTSFYKSTQRKDEWALPGWSVDFKKYFPEGKVQIMQPVNTPTVSYCGYIDYSNRTIKDFVKSIVKPANNTTWENKAKVIRGKACRALKGNQKIKTDFIIRNGFWAHGMNDKRAARKQYAENMIGSLYGIATRGGGNFSYRLYEILSCGRIPIFINTDAVLPFDSIIDWKKHVVWVEEENLKNIDNLLLDFHASKTVEELKEMQRANRKLYEDFISPLGFHKTLGEYILKNLI